MGGKIPCQTTREYLINIRLHSRALIKPRTENGLYFCKMKLLLVKFRVTIIYHFYCLLRLTSREERVTIVRSTFVVCDLEIRRFCARQNFKSIRQTEAAVTRLLSSTTPYCKCMTDQRTNLILWFPVECCFLWLCFTLKIGCTTRTQLDRKQFLVGQHGTWNSRN